MSNIVRVFQGFAGTLFSACLIASFAWAQAMQVIELEHRTAEEVIPVLEPLLESGGAISGAEYTLFVRASAANIEQLRRVLAAIDKAPRQMLVSVRQSTRAEIERERLSASGTIRTGDAGVAVNEPVRDGSGVTVRGTASTDRRDADRVATVQVLEGNAAYIASGETVPVVTAVAVGGGRRARVGAITEYRDMTSGYQVIPRVAGDQVTLDIDQQSERLGTGSDIQTQSLSTRISGPLGEWLELGGIEEAASAQQRGVLTRGYATRSDQRSLWIKVELASTSP